MTQSTSNAIDLPSWKLDDLYTSPEAPSVAADLLAAKERALSFKALYKGKLGSLSPTKLLEALQEFEQINELADKPLCYAYLLHASDSSKPEFGAFLAKLQEQSSEINQELTFFTLEWNSLSNEEAQPFLQDSILEKYHHFLSDSRKFKPYQLSEAEEVLLQKVNLTNRPAWTRLFDEVIGRMSFCVKLPTGEKTLNEEETLSLLYSAEREVRAAAAKALTEGLKAQAPLLSYLFNILVQEHAIEDRFRGLPHPYKARNLSNEIADEAVQSLMQSTESQTHLVARFYKLKTKLLGLSEMLDYDRYAPLPNQENKEEKQWSWKEAKDFVWEAYQSFSPEFGDIVKRFFDEQWIDAALRPGKRGGAFSASTVPSVHPYILVNFTGTSRDVSTLAHELGHGIHQYLSRQVGYLEADTPLTTAETASVFGEMLIFEKLLARAQSKQEKLSLLVTKLDEIFATVFRQVFMTRFEESLHLARREKGELPTEQINELWLKANRAMFGESVRLSDDYGYWWLYISHFIHSPFYCYAYAFGLLLSITLFHKSKAAAAEGKSEEFKKQYRQILSLGGSVTPIELIRIAGVDIAEPSFWLDGFKLIEEMLKHAEALSAEIKG